MKGDYFQIILKYYLLEDELMSVDEFKVIENIFTKNGLTIEMFQRIVKEDNISIYCGEAELTGQDTILHLLISIHKSDI